MSFQTPWMLLGLLFVGFPIWLHFKERHSAVIPFPAFPLLAETTTRRRPKIRLRRFILLLCRVLLIAALITAAARPAISVVRPGGIRTGAPTALVILLDNSMSMRLEDANGESLFEKAKKIAAQELERLRPGDAAALITTCEAGEAPGLTVDFDIVQSQGALEAAQITYRPGRLKQKLMSTLRLLEDCPLTGREVLLISDLNEGEDLEIPPWPSHTQVSFRVIDPAPNLSRNNRAVTKIHVSPSPAGVQREVVVEAEIANFSPKAEKRIAVVLEIDGREAARGSVDLPANGIAIKRFFHRFKEDGVFRGTVRIPEDRLRADDRRYFSVLVSHSISTLIIDGDFRPGSYYDEAFYLQRALVTASPGEAPIKSTVIDAATALKTPLAGHDVVILAGVPAVASLLAGRLIQYVRQGGGLLISPHETAGNLDTLAPILPAKIRSIRQTVKSKPYAIGAVNRAHPLFDLFGEGSTGLEKTAIYRHLLFDAGLEGETHALIDTKDGLPLMLERKVDRGMVMVLGVTVDRAWSDLPIRPGFLPLMQRSVRSLAGRLDDRNPEPVETGHSVQIEVSEGMQRLTVRGPGEHDTVYTAKQLDGKSHVVFRQTEVPGEYVVWTETPHVGGLKEQPSLGFSVVVHPSESDLSRKIHKVDDNHPDRVAAVAGKLPVWPYLLAAVLLLVLLETFIGGAGIRRSHFRIRPKAGL